jgi:bis(5'-nucleosyl)-tetraphosphatase (symmetrical)
LATWIVGDIHGWSDVFERLLERLDFDWAHDRLWLAGDLVNRGPGSLAMLRRAREIEARLGPRFVAVLGNHDLHLLAHAAGVGKKSVPADLEQVLRAPDRDELIAWLARRPLAHAADGALLVHAGLWPQWTLEQTLAAAADLQTRLVDPVRRLPLLRPKDVVAGDSETARALYALTNLRMCDLEGTAACAYKGTPAEAPAHCHPWFALPGRRTVETLVVFGHWAALGLHIGSNVVGLDSGCAWGGFLSALRLEDRLIVQEPNPAEIRRS